MRVLGLILLFVSAQSFGFKVAVPAIFESMSKQELMNIKNADLSLLKVADQQEMAFYFLLNAMADHDLELVYLDQKQKAQTMLYEGEIDASLFLERLQSVDGNNLSKHYEYSLPVIEQNQWRYGLFVCKQQSAFESISLIVGDEYLLTGLEEYNQLLISQKSWQSAINDCKNNQNALVLPLKMNGVSMMGQTMYFTGKYILVPSSYHIVFSSQRASALKMKEIIDSKLKIIKKPMQELIGG